MMKKKREPSFVESLTYMPSEIGDVAKSGISIVRVWSYSAWKGGIIMELTVSM